MASVPGLDADTPRWLHCFAANTVGASTDQNVRIRPLTLPKFSSLRLFYDEITNTSAKIRWLRWNRAYDVGAAPVVGYKIFILPIESGDSAFDLPPDVLTDEVSNSTFQVTIDERNCGASPHCQFVLRDLEPSARYLVGVMPVRPGKGGDNGTIAWSQIPMSTLCGKPSEITNAKLSVKWKNGEPRFLLSLDPPALSANCPEPGDFAIFLREIATSGSIETQISVPAAERFYDYAENLKVGSNYSMEILYVNTEGERSDPIHLYASTIFPLSVTLVTPGPQSVTIAWNVTSPTKDWPVHFLLEHWQGSLTKPVPSEYTSDAIPTLDKVMLNAAAICLSNDQGGEDGDSLQCSAFIDGIDSNTEHFFLLTAFDESEEEAYRSEIIAATTTCEVPSAPYNLTLARQSSETITIEWDVDLDEHCSFGSYQIDLSSEALHMVLNVSNPLARSYDFHVSDLRNWLTDENNVASVKVRVINSLEMKSSWSGPTTIIVMSTKTTTESTTTTTTTSTTKPTTTTTKKEATSGTTTTLPMSSSNAGVKLPNTTTDDGHYVISSTNPTSFADDGQDNAGMVSVELTMVVGIVVGCCCLVSMITVVCVVIFK